MWAVGALGAIVGPVAWRSEVPCPALLRRVKKAAQGGLGALGNAPSLAQYMLPPICFLILICQQLAKLTQRNRFAAGFFQFDSLL